ncbi:MAG TPA: shikimate dehydrogenase [Jiangellales bacterium]|nr:shikimate dehydrogenase [Jiangellales bacterium]
MPDDDPGTGRRCAVLGSPVTHSLSPVLHRAAYEHLGLDWTYEAIEVDEAGLPDLVRGLDPSWRGLSLTMPLKRAVPGLADDVSATASLVGAANTMVREGPGRWAAHNTDVPGMVAALRERDAGRPARAAVVGGGATAVGAVAALARLGIGEPVVYVRSPRRAEEVATVAERLSVRPVVRPWDEVADALDADLVVSTTPAGATDELADRLAAGAGRDARGPARRAGSVLFDVVYDPWPTRLARAWARDGGTVLGGLDLLVHQALLQVRLFTGSSVPVDVLRLAGEAALRRPPAVDGGSRGGLSP